MAQLRPTIKQMAQVMRNMRHSHNMKLAGPGKYCLLVSHEAQENDPGGKPAGFDRIQDDQDIRLGSTEQPCRCHSAWLNFSPENVCIDGDYAYVSAW